MTLNEAKAILLQAKETVRFGSHNDMLCHNHNLVNALEFMVKKYDELMTSELDEVALIQHNYKKGDTK